VTWTKSTEVYETGRANRRSEPPSAIGKVRTVERVTHVAKGSPQFKFFWFARHRTGEARLVQVLTSPCGRAGSLATSRQKRHSHLRCFFSNVTVFVQPAVDASRSIRQTAKQLDELDAVTCLKLHPLSHRLRNCVA